MVLSQGVTGQGSLVMRLLARGDVVLSQGVTGQGSLMMRLLARGLLATGSGGH